MCFHRKRIVNLRIIDQSILESWRAHTIMYCQWPKLDFFPQYYWHGSPTITLPRNTWQRALGAREFLILFPFFETILCLSNHPGPSVKGLNGIMWFCHGSRTASHLKFVLPTIYITKTLSNCKFLVLELVYFFCHSLWCDMSWTLLFVR